MIAVLQHLTTLGTLLTDAQKAAVGIDPLAVAVYGPTELYSNVVTFLELILDDAEYSNEVERGEGIKLPLGFDVTVLAEGLKADIGISADHSVSFTTESGVFKKGKVYKLEQYDPTSVDISNAATLVQTYTDAFGITKTITDAFRQVSRTVDQALGWIVKSTGSAELRLANADDNLTVKGLLSYDFQPLLGPVLPHPARTVDIQGDPTKPHYGIGGFHQFLPQDAPLTAPATLILDYNDAEAAGFDKSSLAMYRWNEDRQDWDLAPATAAPATNTVTTQIAQLGLFTLAPPMPAGSIDWSANSAATIDAGLPTEHRHTSLVSAPLAMNNGGAVPAGTIYHVISAAPGSFDQNGYVQFGTITTPDLQPDVVGTQIAVGADGLLHVEIDLPAGATGLTVVAFSDSGTAKGASPVVLP
jgi:hypothetical protein